MIDNLAVETTKNHSSSVRKKKEIKIFLSQHFGTILVPVTQNIFFLKMTDLEMLVLIE